MQMSFKPRDFWLQLCSNYFFLAIQSEYLAESVIYNIFYFRYRKENGNIAAAKTVLRDKN